MHIINNTLELEENNTCIYGRVDWLINHGNKNTGCVTVIFEGLPCTDLSLMFEVVNDLEINFKKKSSLRLPKMRVRINDEMTLRLFIQAIVEIFAIAFAKADEE